jgi:hypothetical protein
MKAHHQFLKKKRKRKHIIKNEQRVESVCDLALECRNGWALRMQIDTFRHSEPWLILLTS